MMPTHTPSITKLRELRRRASQRLAAAVPVAIESMAEWKAKLEARIVAGKKLSFRHQQELDEIRALLNRTDRAKVCALLNRMDLAKVKATLREMAVATGGNQ